MTVETTSSLRIARTVSASPEEAFDAWTKPEHMRNWACPEGTTLEDLRVDLQVGGAYRLRMKDAEGQTFTAFGVYREVDRPNRVVYTWDWEEEDHQVGETVVIATFTAVGDSTEVVVVHEGFPAEEAKVAHEQGWGSCIDRYEQLFS